MSIPLDWGRTNRQSSSALNTSAEVVRSASWDLIVKINSFSWNSHAVRRCKWQGQKGLESKSAVGRQVTAVEFQVQKPVISVQTVHRWLATLFAIRQLSLYFLTKNVKLYIFIKLNTPITQILVYFLIKGFKYIFVYILIHILSRF